jgi:hypothetical protein
VSWLTGVAAVDGEVFSRSWRDLGFVELIDKCALAGVDYDLA